MPIRKVIHHPNAVAAAQQAIIVQLDQATLSPTNVELVISVQWAQLSQLQSLMDTKELVPAQRPLMRFMFVPRAFIASKVCERRVQVVYMEPRQDFPLQNVLESVLWAGRVLLEPSILTVIRAVIPPPPIVPRVHPLLSQQLWVTSPHTRPWTLEEGMAGSLSVLRALSV